MSQPDIRTCAICGGANLERIYRREVLRPLWHLQGNDASTVDLAHDVCMDCGYIFLENPLGQDEWDAYYSTAPVPARQTLDSRIPMLEERRHFIAQNLPAGYERSVMEVGAAHGDFLRLMTDFDRRVAVEPSVECGSHLKAMDASIDVISSDLEAAYQSRPDLHEAVDLVVACNVLEHVNDPMAFVGYLAGFARRNGHVYIEVPSVEAMADCAHPVYQTVHVGHLSQFSEAVVNRMCAESSLVAVAITTSAEHDYPVMRCLFRKAADADRVKRQFLQHAAAVDLQASKARAILIERLSGLAAGEAVIWGVGQDLFDVVSAQSEEVLALLRSKLRLVDANPDKHGKVFVNLPVYDIGSVEPENIRVVFIACRSDLLQMDIGQSAGKAFPGAAVVSLFSDV